jgi:hypothetical protein
MAKGKAPRVETSQIGEVDRNRRSHSGSGWMKGEMFCCVPAGPVRSSSKPGVNDPSRWWCSRFSSDSHHEENCHSIEH